MAKKRDPITLKQRFAVLKRDGFACRYCGRKPPDVVLEVDHGRSVSGGGENSAANLVSACFQCNRGKRDESIIPAECYVCGDLLHRAGLLTLRAGRYNEVRLSLCQPCLAGCTSAILDDPLSDALLRVFDEQRVLMEQSQ